MTVNTNGSEYFVNIAGAKERYDDPIKAKIAMVIDLGLDEKTANEIIDDLVDGISKKGHIKMATTNLTRIKKYYSKLVPPDNKGTLNVINASFDKLKNQLAHSTDRNDTASATKALRAIDREKVGFLKLAYTGDMYPTPFEETPYSNEMGQPTYTGVAQENRLGGEESYTGDPTRQGLGVMPEINGVDPSYVQQAVQLAQNGQKEIFDVQAISTLARYSGVNDKVTEYLPSMVEAMDRMGRILFLMHWDTEKFVDMYGRSDLPELVELITNVFKNLGDLVIFLKRKSPELSINMNKDDALDV